MYETFDHTADLGLRIRAADLDTLFVEAARALTSVIVTDPAKILPTQTRELTLPADDVEYLLFDWLKTLLYWFDDELLLFARFECQVSDQGLKACAWGEMLDRTRHNLEHEVKAITYHDFAVRHGPDGWLAEVIVDI